MTGQINGFMCLCEGRRGQRENAKENDMTNDTTTRKRDEQLLAIAKAQMNASAGEPILDTLETRNADHLDFFEIAVWDLKAMLSKAYSAGYEDAVEVYDDGTTCDDDNTSLHLAVKARYTPSEIATVIATIRLLHIPSGEKAEEVFDGLCRFADALEELFPEGDLQHEYDELGL